MMTNYFVLLQRINFSKTLSVLTTTLFFTISKHLIKNIFIKKNYLKWKVINLFLITDVTAFKKTIMAGFFLYKILRKLKTSFEDKTSFVIKMSKSELINSALEDENNGFEESETSDDEFMPGLTSLQLYMFELCVSRESLKESCPGKKIIRFGRRQRQNWKYSLVFLW